MKMQVEQKVLVAALATFVAGMLVGCGESDKNGGATDQPPVAVETSAPVQTGQSAETALEERVVGKWRADDRARTLTFFTRDGKFQIILNEPRIGDQAPGPEDRLNGTWKLLGGGRIELNIDRGKERGIQSQVGRIGFFGDQMVITGQNGAVSRYTRVQ